MSTPAYQLPTRPSRAPAWLIGDEQEWLKAQRERQAPAWVMGDVDDWLDKRRDQRFVTQELEPIRFEQNAGGELIEGRVMPYLEWTEIRSLDEGHFLERFFPGAFADQISKGIGRVRVLFEHGTDRLLGRQIIAKITQLQDRPDGLYYRAELLHGVPALVVSGLRAGLYGSSVRFRPIEAQRTRFPGRTDWNPRGLPEQTVQAAELRELSVVAFPAYMGTTAIVTGKADAQ
jgi:HK97 family phage prohead protease